MGARQLIDRLTEKLYGGRVTLKTTSGDFRCVVSRNTRVGEDPYRVTLDVTNAPGRGASSTYMHVPLTKEEADQLLNLQVPPRVWAEVPFNILAVTGT